jgi:hypothetical protein
MKVEYRRYQPGVAYGNILFKGTAWPMRGWNKFPKDHPFYDNIEPTTFGHPLDGTDRLAKFRQAGYYASCFPEGDGISFQPLGNQTEEKIREDITNILQLEIV